MDLIRMFQSFLSKQAVLETCLLPALIIIRWKEKQQIHCHCKYFFCIASLKEKATTPLNIIAFEIINCDACRQLQGKERECIQNERRAEKKPSQVSDSPPFKR